MAEVVGRENRVRKNQGGKAKGVGGRHEDTREKAVGTEMGPGTDSGSGEGLERASATALLMPGICTTELVNSAR